MSPGHPRRGHLVIVSLVGGDGAGKSTVSRLAAERLTAQGLMVDRVERWDIVDNPAYPATRFMRPDTQDARLCVAEMPNTSRFLFLMWSMGMALEGRVPAPAGPGTVTLLDGYWMKHAAGEIVYGLDRPWVESVVSGLPPSQSVTYLRLSPEQAWERKAGKDLLPYECGMDPSCSRERFLAHQQGILDLLDEWSARFGWLEVDASQPLDELASRVGLHVAKAVADAFGGTPTAAAR
ncbi:thymidylate kinase [Streptomyces sp. NPDC058401]|uniref:thymidylate kinase n=1 Tax=Streptomyces sp. NPDC058401 TaxID=3346480 RepID=UPI0036589078